MTQIIINTGVADKGNGDPIRTAFTKVNANFTELYTLVGAASLTELAQDYAAEMFTDGTHVGVAVEYDDASNVINLTALGQTSSGATAPVNPTAGTLWWDSVSGRLYVYYGAAWVDASPVDGAGISSTNELVNGAHSVVLGTDGTLTLPDSATVAVGSEAEIAALELVYEDFRDQLTDAFAGANYTGDGYPASVDSYQQLTESVDPAIQPSWIVLAKAAFDAYEAWVIAQQSIGFNIDVYGRQWTFASNRSQALNSLVIPENTTISGPDSILLRAEDANKEARIDLDAELNRVSIGTTSRTWAFSNDGVLTLPTVGKIGNGASEWTFTEGGTLVVPSPQSNPFTLEFTATNYVATGPKPTLALTGDPWTVQGQYQYAANGDCELILAQIGPNLVNPGYESGDEFTFEFDVHGILGHVLTIQLNSVVQAGPAGWTANAAASQPPEYPSSIYAGGAVKLTTNIDTSWIFGADGTLTLPGDLHVGNNSIREDGLFSQQFSIAAGAGKRVEISSDDGEKVWSFDTNGTLTFPNGGVVSEASNTIAVGLDQFTAGGFTGPQVFFKTSDTLYSSFGSTIELVSGIWRLKVGPSTYYDSLDLITWSPVAGGLPAPVGTLDIILTTNLAVGDKTWGFDTRGGLTTPDGSIGGDGGGNIVLASAAPTKSVQIWSGQGLHVWEFGEDGNLTLPSGFVTSNEVTGVNLRSGYDVSIISNHMDVDQEWIFGSDGALALPQGAVINETASSPGLLRKKYSGTFVLDPTWFAANAGNLIETSTLTGTIQNVDNPFDPYCFEYTGYFVPPTSNIYTFKAHADETFVFWIGAKALSGYTFANKDMYGDYNGTSPEQQTQSFTIGLTAGQFYPIRIQWGNSGGFGQLDVFTWAEFGGADSADFSGLIYTANTGAAIVSVDDNKSIVLRTANDITNNWNFAPDGSLTFPDNTVQSTAYVAPTTGNSTIISDPEGTTVSRNGMTIRVTSTGMIQMSFDSVIYITGRSSINNADSVVIASPNGVTTIGTWYNIGAVLAEGDHLTATIVDESYHHIYRLTAIIIQKTTTPGQEIVVSYAIIEQLQ